MGGAANCLSQQSLKNLLQWWCCLSSAQFSFAEESAGYFRWDKGELIGSEWPHASFLITLSLHLFLTKMWSAALHLLFIPLCWGTWSLIMSLQIGLWFKTALSRSKSSCFSFFVCFLTLLRNSFALEKHFHIKLSFLRESERRMEQEGWRSAIKWH